MPFDDAWRWQDAVLVQEIRDGLILERGLGLSTNP